MEQQATEKQSDKEHLRVLVGSIAGCRGWRRDNLTKDFSNKFLYFLKENNNIAFSREEINTLIDVLNLTERQKDNIVRCLLDYMIKFGMVKKETTYIKVWTWRNKPLSSCDYGSYAVLMQKNGYKINKEETAFTNSWFPEHRQGVYTYGNLSVKKEIAYKYPKEVFVIC